MKWFLSLLAAAVIGVGGATAQPAPEPFAAIDALRLEGAFDDALERLEARRTGGLTDRVRAEVLWRIAWTMVDIGEQASGEDRQEELYREARAVAQEAVAADSANGAAHLALAIATGRTALLAGTRERIELSRSVKDHADLAIRLAPENDGAYHTRARWHFEVASLGFFERSIVKLVYGGLPDASYEQAVADFERALALDDRIVHRLELGRTLLEMGRDEAAREQLELVLRMPVEDPDDPAYKREAERLHGKL